MPILKSLKKLSWTTLAAELVLVFVGITAALWFDNWNAERREEILAREILSEIAIALQADTTDLNANLRNSARVHASVDTVLFYLDQDLPYVPELDAHFGRATSFTNFIRNTGAYEQLKGAGLPLITDEALRRTIVRYYEVQGELLHQIETIFLNRHFETSVQPQMIEKFSYRGFLSPATPHDYESLKDDLVFRSSLTTKLGWLDWKDTTTRRVLRLAEELIQEIEAASD